LISGHEPCGVIAALGPNVPAGIGRVGDRVMVYHYAACGVCNHCRAGWQQHCTDVPLPVYGNNDHGAHAQYIKVAAMAVLRCLASFRSRPARRSHAARARPVARCAGSAFPATTRSRSIPGSVWQRHRSRRGCAARRPPEFPSRDAGITGSSGFGLRATDAARDEARSTVAARTKK
jgi:hypothetical protein